MGLYPRRVTVLIDSLLAGGAERVAVEAAAALDPRRYVPHLLVARHSGPLEAFVRERGVAYTILGRTRRVDPVALVRSCRIVASADLVHSHKFAGSLWGWATSTATGRPLVVHEHTFDRVGMRARRLGYRWIIAPRARRIVCVSQSVRRSLIAEGVRAELVEVVPNGVPTNVALPRAAARAELGLEPEAKVIGMVARLRPEKRHELALEALARLGERHDDVVLCVVGDGPRGPSLRRRAEELGVADRVRWAGERPDARRLVRAFDVAVLCSSFEAMPLAALELLVAGVPLVATPVGDLPEILVGGGGIVVPPDDVDALASAVADQLSRADPASAGDLLALQLQFGLDRMVAELQRIYDEVLEASSRVPPSR